jgi:hypothetical protein
MLTISVASESLWPSYAPFWSIPSGADASTIAHRLRQRQPTSITSSRGLGICWTWATTSCSRIAGATARNATGFRPAIIWPRVAGTEHAVRSRYYNRTGATRRYRRTGVLEPRSPVGHSQTEGAGGLTWVRADEMVPLAAKWRDLIQP